MSRRIVDPNKKAFIDQVVQDNEPPAPPIKLDDTSDFSMMLLKTVEILRRDITHLMMESSQGKLSKSSATDLVNYVKLLSDLYKQEKEILSNLSTEEIKALVTNEHSKT